MRPFRVLLALGLIVCVARAGEITNEDETVVKGCEIVSFSTREVVYKSGGKVVTRAIAKIRKIDLRDVTKILANKKYSQVDLTDGTSLLVSDWAIKAKDLEMTLLSGPKVKMPIGLVNGILNNASEEKDRTDWRNRVINTRGREAVVLKRKVTRFDKKENKHVDVLDENGKPLMVLMNLPATIGDGDAKGETIEFGVVTDKGAEKLVRKQKSLHGIIFKNTLGPRAPGVVCALMDTTGSVVNVSKVTAKNGGLEVTTPAGAKLEFAAAQISRIDYTTGRLEYLSALMPVATNVTVNPLDDKQPATFKWFVYKDSNLDGRPIKLGGTSYRHGLTLLPEVELVYNLGGAYSRFDAVIGIDDDTKAEGGATVEIWGNNKKLDTIEITYRTEKGKNGEPVAPPKKVVKKSLNVRGVGNLRIVFKPKDDLSGVSMSVSLGDAKVIK